jgi:predicted phage-related endonuclease
MLDATLMLTAAQHKARDGKVTASFLPKLMSGDEAAILNEWRRLVGDPAYVPLDLDNVWAVQFGSFVETFALDWHQRKTGRPIEGRGQSLTDPKRSYVACTLDGFRPDDSTVIDCKAPGAHRKLDDVLALYVPQMVIQRSCKGAAKAALLVVHGGAEPVEYPIDIPADYEAAVWQRVDAFWQCVCDLRPPFSVPPVPPPVKAERIVDISTSNSWAVEAAAWLANYPAKREAEAAEKALKALVPADAAKCHGAGVVITRSRAGSLSLREAS